MRVKDLIPIIEGQIEHLVIGTNTKGILAERNGFPYSDSVETFLRKFKEREIICITPMESGHLEITIR